MSTDHEDLVSDMVRRALREIGGAEGDFLLAQEQPHSPDIEVSIRTPTRGNRSFMVRAAEIDVDFALDRSGLERAVSARVVALYR